LKHPWDGIIPEVDVLSFRKGPEFVDRPIDAGTKPALIIIDMTRAFVDSAYPTGWSETGYPAAAANAKLLAAARRFGYPVFFTKGYASPDYKPAPGERGLWRGTGSGRQVNPDLPPGDVIVDEITPIEGEIVINKGGKPSGFFGTPLTSLLIMAKVDTCIITGMTTSGCVRSTVLDAFQNNFSTIIPHEACADRSQVSHAVSLFDMHMKYSDVASVDATIAYMESVAVKELALA
jgi:nicotinamidase-related amidase